MRTTLRSYAEAEAFLGGKQSRKVAHNTWVELRTAGITIRFHVTDIVLYLESTGSVVLSSGGWRTTTTKRRLNCFSPFQVWQRNFDWFIDVSEKPVPFVDGMLLQRSEGQGWRVA